MFRIFIEETILRKAIDYAIADIREFSKSAPNFNDYSFLFLCPYGKRMEKITSIKNRLLK